MSGTAQSSARSIARRTRQLLLQSKAVHSIQPTTVVERLAKFKALRDKAQTYGDLLGMRQNEIDEALSALTAKAQGLLMTDELPGINEAPAVPLPPSNVVTPPPAPPSASDDRAREAEPDDDLGGLFDEE